MITNIEEIKKNFKKNIFLNESLAKYNWFNLGGPAGIFFKPNYKEELINFLKLIENKEKIFCLGAGSNTLIRDGGFDGVVIKLSSKFSYVNLLEDNVIEAGAATLDKKVSSFAQENELGGLEFLSCIPGSIGGAIIMNSGCYGEEISQYLISIKVLDFNGREIEIKKNQIDFFYRGTSLPKDLIILSAKFKCKKMKKEKINEIMNNFISKKKNTQPSRIKTCGSTFKNPKEAKAWKLIKESGCRKISVGKASISEKHCNFFVNEGGASSKDIESLIHIVKKRVLDKYKIKLDLEINLIGESK